MQRREGTEKELRERGRDGDTDKAGVGVLVPT